MSADVVRLSHSEDGDAATLDLEGENGRLSLATVHFVVAEFELERAEHAVGCDDDADDGTTGGDVDDDGGPVPELEVEIENGVEDGFLEVELGG